MLVEVRFTDSTIERVDVPDYDAKKLAIELNTNQQELIALGDMIMHKHSIYRVVPVRSIDPSE